MQREWNVSIESFAQSACRSERVFIQLVDLGVLGHLMGSEYGYCWVNPGRDHGRVLFTKGFIFPGLS